MRQRLSPITAVVSALAALVVSLVFGSETYIREVVVERRGEGNLGVVAQYLGAPNYSRYVGGQGSGAFDRYGFLLVMTLAVGLLVLATVRGGNGFVAGWTATVAAGALAGLVRGLVLADRYSYGGGGRDGATLASGFQGLGNGAVYGFLIGAGVGVIAQLGALLSRSTFTPGVPAGAPGVPPGWAPAGPPPPVPSAAAWSTDRPATPDAAPWSAAPPPAGPVDGDEATRVAPPVPPVPPGDRPPPET